MANRYGIIMILAVLSLEFFCACTQPPTTVNTSSTTFLTSSTQGAQVSVTQTTMAATSPANASGMTLGEYVTDYTGLQYAGDLAGLPAYVGSNGTRKFILYQGREIGVSYDQAIMPEVLNNTAFYIGIKNNKYYAVYDGKPVGNAYFHIWSPGIFKGQLIYVAETLGKSVLVENGQEVQTDYQYIWSYAVFGDKIAYLASKFNETYVPENKINSLTSENRRDVPPEGVKAVINFGGQEFGRKYDSVYFPMNVGGKLAYVALKAGKKFIVFDGMEAPSYNEVYEPLLFDGKIAYLAELNGSGVFVYDGMIKASYSRVDPESLKGMDGKLSFRAADKDKPKGRYFIVYDGTEIGKGYDNVLSFAASGAKQAYLAEKNATRYVVYDGHAIQHGYDYIDPTSLSFHNGKLSFVAQKSGKWYIIREE